MIRVLIVDDHPAVRAGLVRLVRGEPGFVVVDVAGSMEQAVERAARDKPDVAVLDYHLPGGNGLVLCRRLKQLDPAPAVLIYSAFADDELVVPAALAGADGLLNKAAPVDDLFEAMRIVARGGSVRRALPAEVMAALAQRLEPEDLPILGMAADGATAAEIAEALRIDEALLDSKVMRLIDTLRPRVRETYAVGT